MKWRCFYWKNMGSNNAKEMYLCTFDVLDRDAAGSLSLC
jgi:hypothetical protein